MVQSHWLDLSFLKISDIQSNAYAYLHPKYLVLTYQHTVRDL